MNSKELRLFREAYGSVYTSQTEEVVEETVAEGLGEKAAELLDKGTKGIQGSLEKMGVPINRTKRQMGTSPRVADHMRKAGVGPSEKPTGLNNSADLFDIVKGHLLDEGYADTEEAALAIMANMSEEWRQSIVESCGMEHGKKKKKGEKKSGY